MGRAARLCLTALCGWIVAAATAGAQQAEAPTQEAIDLPRGQAGVVVSVVDERGAPLPDAEVLLRFEEAPRGVVLRTDSDGQAEVNGIAAGEWQVDVRREGFMLFNAYVLLEPGKKPKVAFSSRQRTGSYWEPLQAVFLPPGVDLGRGVASGRESIKQAQQRAERASKDSLRRERRAERQANRGRLARVVASEPVRPVVKNLVEQEPVVASSEQVEPAPGDPVLVAEATAAEPVVPAESAVPDASTTGERESIAAPTVRSVDHERVAAVADSDAPGTEPFESTAPASAAAEDKTAARETAGRGEGSGGTSEQPQPSSVAVQSTASAPNQAASQAAVAYPTLDPPPRILRNPNLLPAGACPECGPGEFSVMASGQAEKFQRGDACTLDRVEGVAALADELNGGLAENLGAFAGSLMESNGNDVLRLLPPALRTRLEDELRRTPKSCQLLGLVLPRGARYIGFRYQAGERSVMAECLETTAEGKQSCQVGDAQWLAPPTVIRTEGVTVLLGVFENRSKRSTRLPRLVAYFEPARGWLPPSR